MLFLPSLEDVILSVLINYTLLLCIHVDADVFLLRQMLTALKSLY